MVFLFLVALIMAVAAIRFLRRGLRPYGEHKTRDIVMGLCLLVFSLPVIVLNTVGIGVCTYNTVVYSDWHSLKETEELIAEIRTQPPKTSFDGKPDPLVRAYDELQRRIEDDELTESEMKALAASCLPKDGRMATPSGERWELYRTRVLHELSRRGALTPSQKSQFYEALVDISLHARTTT